MIRKIKYTTLKIITFFKIITAYGNPYISFKETFNIIIYQLKILPKYIKKDIVTRSLANQSTYYLASKNNKYTIDVKVNNIRELAEKHFDKDLIINFSQDT